MARLSITLATTVLASLALAKTDLTGCTSTDISSPAGASVAWYVPGTGELCDFLDCGGGRAPPKTDVPGCAAYSGTATYSPSYLPGYGSMSASTAIQTTASTIISSSAATENNPTVMTTSWSDSLATSASLENSAAQISTVVTTSSAQQSDAVVQTSTVLTTGPATSSSAAGGADAASATPSSYTGAGVALEAANVWVSGAALIGLGALVVAM